MCETTTRMTIHALSTQTQRAEHLGYKGPSGVNLEVLGCSSTFDLRNIVSKIA